MQTRYSLLPLALAATFPAQAADLPLYQGETTFVTATRFASNPSQLASDVTVITAEDIAKSSATDLPSLLAKQPGIAMAQNGGPGQLSSLLLRGTNARHTLLLVDGQRVNAITSGQASWQMIPLELIDRIEIVRGGASGAYGADAIGGVLQIFTKQGGGKPHATASVEYGSYGHKATSAGLGGAAGNLRYNLSVRASEDGGINATKPGNYYYHADRDGDHNTGFNGNLAYFINESHEVGAQLLYSDSRTQIDNSAADPIMKRRLLNYSAYSRNTLLPGWQSTIRIGESRDWSQSNDLDWMTSAPIINRYDTRQQQVNWSNRFDTPYGNWLLGAETLGDTLHSTTQYNQTTRRTNAVFGGWSQKFGIHSLQANVRHDQSSQFGGFNSGNLGYNIEFIKDFHVYTNIGRAYHAPTFDFLYFPNYDNPNLKPEKARTEEIGFKARIVDWKFNLAVFQNHISDMIVSPSPTYKPENIEKAKIHGVTFGTEGRIAGVNLEGNITWQDPRNENTDKILQRQARVLGNAKASYRYGAWYPFVELTGQGARFDSVDNTTTSRMHGYVLTNIGADYRVAKDWKASLRVNNVFDQHYELVQNYSTMGRNALIKLTWNGNL